MGFPKSPDGTPHSAPPNWLLGQSRFLRTDDGSAPMNIDGTPGGTSVVLWNGTGAGDTGGDWTAGDEGSETAGSMRSGTNGWDTGAATKDGYTSFDNGSELDIDGTYQTLQFWMNPQAYPNKSELQIEWRNAADGKIGSTLNIEDYVTDFDIGVWQQVSIPISDFGLTANVQKLRIVYGKEAGQQFYYDDMELLESGGGGGPCIMCPCW